MINEAVEYVAVGDFGAGHSAFPATIIRELSQCDRNFAVHELNESLKLEVALTSPATKVTASAKAILNITLMLLRGPFDYDVLSSLGSPTI